MPNILGRITIQELRKHWKNIRDRFVKVRNQRELHFANGGGETSAPKYCYFQNLEFLKDFCVNTIVKKEDTEDYVISAKEMEPEPLLFMTIEQDPDDNEKVISGDYIDYTEKLLEEIKIRPELHNYELVQNISKSKDTKCWLEVAKALENKFTPQNLKNYWGTLLKKYKIYVENEGDCYGNLIKIFSGKLIIHFNNSLIFL